MTTEELLAAAQSIRFFGEEIATIEKLKQKLTEGSTAISGLEEALRYDSGLLDLKPLFSGILIAGLDLRIQEVKRKIEDTARSMSGITQVDNPE